MKLFMDGTKLNLHVSEVVSWWSGESIIPIHAELSLTNVCNQKCEFCYINWSHGKDLLSKEAALSFVDEAKEIGYKKSVLIAGEGEPTLNPHWREIIERFHARKLDVCVKHKFCSNKRRWLWAFREKSFLAKDIFSIKSSSQICSDSQMSSRSFWARNREHKKDGCL